MNAHLHTALTVAYRHINDATTTKDEGDSILECMVEHMPAAAAEDAAVILQLRREERAREHQLTARLSNGTHA